MLQCICIWNELMNFENCWMLLFCYFVVLLVIQTLISSVTIKTTSAALTTTQSTHTHVLGWLWSGDVGRDRPTLDNNSSSQSQQLWEMCGPALASWPWLTPTLAPDCCQLSNPEPISSITCEIVTHHQYCLILETELEYSGLCTFLFAESFGLNLNVQLFNIKMCNSIHNIQDNATLSSAPKLKHNENLLK